MATDDNKPYLGFTGGEWYPKPREAIFECRVCGSKEFYRLQMTGRDGKQKDTECWQCSGCSVVFKNWRQFTKYPGGRME